MTTQTANILADKTIAELLPAAAAVLIGSFMFFGVAFAQPMEVHNAAHDTRHAMAFPCH